MKVEFKKGDILGWRLTAELRHMIKELELEEIVRVKAPKELGKTKVLRQQATKSFVIEITIDD